MPQRRRDWVTWGLAVGLAAAAVGMACHNNTSAPVATPCPTYHGGSATVASVAGTYTLVSFCQDTLPVFGPPAVTGSLILTAVTPDSFKATINIPSSPVVLAGPYSISHDSITVNLPSPYGTFVGTYQFAAHGSSPDTLSVSGFLPGSPPPPIAIVFAK